MKGKFICTNEYFGEWYGIQWDSIEAVARQGLACIMTMELEALLSFKQTYFEPRCVLVLTLDNKSRASFDDGRLLQPAELTNDTYTRLTDKVFRAVAHVSARYPDYDWYVKADDDTYMFAENLRWFLSQQDSSQPVTYGYFD